VPAGLPAVQGQPGRHAVAGRQWDTRCSPHGAAGYRCEVRLLATRYVRVGGTWRPRTAWVLNDVAHVDPDGTSWTGSPLVTPGDHELGGRGWRTACTAASGPRTCTTWILAAPVVRVRVDGADRYLAIPRWVLNDLVWLAA